MDQNQFKENVGNVVSQLGKKLILPMAGIYVVFTVVTMAIAISVFAAVTGEGASWFLTFQGDQEKMNFLRDLVKENAGMFLGLFFLTMAVFMLIYSWVVNLFLEMSELAIQGESGIAGKAISRSFSKKVWTMYGLMWIVIVFIVIISLLLGLAVGTLKGSPGIAIIIGFIAGIVIFMFYLRFLAAPGAITHGGMGLSSAISFSWKNISMGKAGLMLLILFGIGIVFGLVSSGLEAVAANMSDNEVTASLIGSVLMLPLNIIAYSYAIAALSTLYYRYAEIPDEEENTDIHMVTE